MGFHQVARGVVSRNVLFSSLLIVCLIGQTASPQGKRQTQRPGRRPPIHLSRSISPEVKSALDRISKDSLRGHLSFIASDLLEGRGTPSRGLDIAAEYIAAQFRRAGLEPVGDVNEAGEKTYFQTANWFVAEPDADLFELVFSDDQQTLRVSSQQVTFGGEQKLELTQAPLVKVDFKDTGAFTAEQIKGRVIVTEIPDYRRIEEARRGEMVRERNEFLSKVSALNPALMISIDRGSSIGRGLGTRRLIDPENRGMSSPGRNPQFLTVHDPRVAKLYDSFKAGETAAKVSLHTPVAGEKPVKLRNVIGLLRGSEPALNNTYVLLTAHYDHLGMRPDQGGDYIFNGANDDGSGTVSVIELASALSSLKQRPKRSIVFMTFFGEERGLLGSIYYSRHPIFPIEKTIANINLEHVGRTDDPEGDKRGTATLTGFDYTDIGATFKEAGELTGIDVYKHERNSDAFFSRSDNQALANQGVPAHTLGVSFIFPDYHQTGDHWEKIDYENMAKVDRMIALALVTIANGTEAPKWNEANPKTERYVKAWRAMNTEERSRNKWKRSN